MIIDAHTHIFARKEIKPDWLWEGLNKLIGARSGKTAEEMAKYRDASFDPTGDIFVSNMDRAGVDKAVVCAIDLGLAIPGEPTLMPIEEINRLTAQIVQRHPHRLYFSVAVDPRRRNAREIVEMGFKELGAKTVKFYPGSGWYPNDPIAYPLYEKCVELGLPVNYHTGPVYGPLKSKFSHPMHIDDVAADFPELTIYCTHCGHGFFMDMVAIARARPNVICDIAAWLHWLYAGEVLHFYQTWRYIMNMIGYRRLLFASDHTGVKFSSDLHDEYVDWVKALTQIPDWVQEAGVTFKKEELEAFFSGNAIRWLKLQ
jgi:predicted TIM-barrel fold metal-dependent hydrolase